MDGRANITKVEILTGKKKKILNIREIKQFCKEKVQISVKLVVDGSQHISDCRVNSSQISSKYEPNDLSAEIAQKHTKSKVESKVRCFKTSLCYGAHIMKYCLSCMFSEQNNGKLSKQKETTIGGTKKNA